MLCVYVLGKTFGIFWQRLKGRGCQKPVSTPRIQGLARMKVAEAIQGSWVRELGGSRARELH